MKPDFFKYACGLGLAVVVLLGCSIPAQAQLSGAIFTTLPDGSAVNFNIYASKSDVYLDGGPPPGAPSTAAGLPDGTYVFQVTDPSGKTLLSLDPARCRQFTVLNGNINGVVVGSSYTSNADGSDARRRAVVWSAGAIRRLPVPDGADFSESSVRVFGWGFAVASGFAVGSADVVGSWVASTWVEFVRRRYS